MEQFDSMYMVEPVTALGDERDVTDHRSLPPGWRWAKLGDVCEVQLGKMLSPKSKRGENPRPYLRNANVQWGEFDLADVARMDFTPDEEERLALRPGDLLVCEGGEPGRAAVWNGQITPCYYQKALHRLRCISSQVDPYFIMYWLWLGVGDGKFINSHGQTTIAHLPAVRLVQLPIALPSLTEQRRIAAILREQLAAVERARAAAEAQLATAKELPAAYLRAVFESDDAKDWPQATVADLCDRIDYGYTASADFSIDEPRFLRITDIQEGVVMWDRVPGCKITESEERANRLAHGDIVFARTGGTTGKSYLVQHPPRSVFASYLIRMRPKPDVVAEFLYAFFQSDGYWQQIRTSARGGAQPNVNASLLAALRLPCPAGARQRDMARMIDARITESRRLRESLQSQLDVINQLPAALLSRAFNGEL